MSPWPDVPEPYEQALMRWLAYQPSDVLATLHASVMFPAVLCRQVTGQSCCMHLCARPISRRGWPAQERSFALSGESPACELECWTPDCSICSIANVLSAGCHGASHLVCQATPTAADIRSKHGPSSSFGLHAMPWQPDVVLRQSTSLLQMQKRRYGK